MRPKPVLHAYRTKRYGLYRRLHAEIARGRLPSQNRAHHERRCRIIARLQGAVELPGRSIIVFGTHQPACRHQMVERFRSSMVRLRTRLSGVECRQNFSIRASLDELGTEAIASLECQRASTYILHNAFGEGFASNQGHQLTIGEWLVFLCPRQSSFACAKRDETDCGYENES